MDSSWALSQPRVKFLLEPTSLSQPCADILANFLESAPRAVHSQSLASFSQFLCSTSAHSPAEAHLCLSFTLGSADQAWVVRLAHQVISLPKLSQQPRPGFILIFTFHEFAWLLSNTFPAFALLGSHYPISWGYCKPDFLGLNYGFEEFRSMGIGIGVWQVARRTIQDASPFSFPLSVLGNCSSSPIKVLPQPYKGTAHFVTAVERRCYLRASFSLTCASLWVF